MSGNHTPTPWKVSPGHAEGAVTVRQDGGEFQRPVAEIWHNGDDPKANAELIVTAVNAYRSNQSEIERLRKVIQSAAEEFVTIELRLRAMQVERALGAVMCGQRDLAKALLENGHG